MSGIKRTSEGVTGQVKTEEGAMAVTRVVDRDLVIEVTDPDHQEMLSPLDQNGDGELSIDDFRLPVLPNKPPFIGSPSDDLVRHFMQETVAEAFVDLDLIETNQREAFARYFDRYNAVSSGVKALKREVPEWLKAPHTDGFSIGYFSRSELQFAPDVWKDKVLPILDAIGSRRSIILGYQLSTDLYRMIHDLTMPEDKWPGTIGDGCDRLAAFTYDGDRLPEVIAGPTDALVRSWGEVPPLFGRYTQIECEGKGCPEQDEFILFFIGLQRGTENIEHFVYCRHRP